MTDTSLLDNIIVGRVDPHIYAFTTGTVPNYLKVGDTYRPVSVRLNEWKEHFPDLEKQYEEIAKVDSDVYFRDFAIHYFLENEKKRLRLQQNDIAEGIYYSKEFFKEATAHDIIDAIDDITNDYQQNGGKYQFYNAESRLAETFTYQRTESYEPRPNQDNTINKFKAAVEAGRTNLLMYAVMRFGKSFTSMCCALQMGEKDENNNPKGADIVAIVSAKADVKEEWKKTVESHTKFADYVFLDGEALKNENIIRDTLDNGKKVAVFLTLQDLQGDEIKEKHKEIFENQIDLLIIDETHFGARAEKYGQVLREFGKEEAKATICKKDSDDFVEAAEADEQIDKVLNAKVKLHLSGTPYRILMGSEFTKEDIIAFYQFPDIVKEQEAWDKENILSDDVKEWDNPYYGFPQMIRFAFNPNESSRQRLKELKENGVSFAFSALLKPKSVKKSDDGNHKKFVYEQEILDLLEVIDGSKNDDELLGFLDYDKIKDGNMCRHIVMVLPYCASCDAMEALIKNNPDKFKNLNEYEIVNISGLDVPRNLGDPQKIKGFIHNCEKDGKKTLTLTVNRMLTGSTVEEWDTMLFLKDTASPQEYDQAIFRLQNQYVKKYIDDNGNVIKYNMKPQTLLVDFEPGRMFSMQEQKAQIYNVNVDEAGNSKLEDRLKEELRISPIIVMNSDKMEQVQATDILNAVSEYSKSRGVAEETMEIPVDLSLMNIDIIRRAIERENELGSKAGLTIKAAEGEGTDIDTEDGETSGTPDDEPQEPDEENSGADTAGEAKDDDKNDPVKQFRSYYARILFFAFLTRDKVISLDDIVTKIESEDNARIAKHIGISKQVLDCIKNNINKFILRDLDYKIHNLNKLSNDTSVDPLERATVAVHKFGKLGESEVITPQNICDDMVALVPDDGFIDAIENGHKILDIAGKAGEFALAVYERYIKLGYDIEQIKDTIYTIPTSGLTYEFTRMIYEILGLNVANIAEKFNDYDLLKVKIKYTKGKKASQDTKEIDYNKICAILSQNKPFNEITIDDEVIEGDENVNFNIIVGNPPYHVSTTNKSAQGTPIYDKFVNIAKNSQPNYITTIIPSRWFAGGMGLDPFRDDMVSDKHISKITSFVNGKDCFPNSSTGGVCYFLWNKKEKTNCHFTTHRANITHTKERDLGKYPFIIRDNIALDIFEKIEMTKPAYLSDFVSSINIFNFESKCRGETHRFSENDYELFSSKGFGYVSENDITTNKEMADKYKVIVSQVISEHAAEPDKNGQYKLLSTLKVLYPKQVCTFSYLVISSFDNEVAAHNFVSYMSTKFARFLILQAVSSIHLTKEKFMFVPTQDYSRAWTDADLYAKYSLTPEEIDFIESTIKPME